MHFKVFWFLAKHWKLAVYVLCNNKTTLKKEWEARQAALLASAKLYKQ